MTQSFDRLGAALAGRYVIERELGAGGMATVYLAHDARHDRPVALKVLRPELSAIIGAQRFLAEIKTTANLQHPHILSLFDSGEADGMVYYVMPYVEGESLRDRLNREKQLPVDQAVRIAREVLDALEYAHQKGIIHRDIKPENIMLHGGHALVADFGIALAASRSNDATRMTETGMSLGTPHYMAPEQAMGERDITARADIYALGCVLYEMLVAEPPFQGPTAQAIIARVMTEEPRRITLQRRTVPPHIEAAILTALSKLPADRFASAQQFADALGNPGFSTASTVPTPAWLARKSPRARVMAVLPWVLFAVVGLLLAWTAFRRPKPVPPRVIRLGLELPAGAAWEDQAGPGLDLSPDGSMLVYNGRDSLGTRFFLRPLDRLDPTALPGTEAANQPVFSPDSRWIGFQRGSQLFRVPVAGGQPELMCSRPSGSTTFSWLDARTLIAADSNGLSSCPLGGTATRLYRLPDSTVRLLWPHALPGGRAVLFTTHDGAEFRLGVFDLRSNEGRMLGIVGSNPRYVGAGYVVYGSQDGFIRAVSFDLDRLEVTGEPMVIMQGARVGSGGAAKMAISRSGTIVAAEGVSGNRNLLLVDRSGRGDTIPLPINPYSYPRFSPDGKQVAVVVGDLSSNIWLYDRGQGTLTRLTFDSAASRPNWMDNGRRIVFSQLRGPHPGLRIINADGSAQSESLLVVPGKLFYQAIPTPDGRSLIARTTDQTGRDIWVLPLDSTRALKPLLTSRPMESGASLSPDGRWMAYVSDESGRAEVYVRAFPGMGARYQVSLSGGGEPVWSRPGNEIIYRNGPAFLSATVRTTPDFQVLSRSTLFSNSDILTGGGQEPAYDLSPDGRSLLLVNWVGRGGGLKVTLNWFENLEPEAARLVPAEPSE